MSDRYEMDAVKTNEVGVVLKQINKRNMDGWDLVTHAVCAFDTYDVHYLTFERKVMGAR